MEWLSAIIQNNSSRKTALNADRAILYYGWQYYQLYNSFIIFLSCIASKLSLCNKLTGHQFSDFLSMSTNFVGVGCRQLISNSTSGHTDHSSLSQKVHQRTLVVESTISHVRDRFFQFVHPKHHNSRSASSTDRLQTRLWPIRVVIVYSNRQTYVFSLFKISYHVFSLSLTRLSDSENFVVMHGHRFSVHLILALLQ